MLDPAAQHLEPAAGYQDNAFVILRRCFSPARDVPPNKLIEESASAGVRSELFARILQVLEVFADDGSAGMLGGSDLNRLASAQNY